MTRCRGIQITPGFADLSGCTIGDGLESVPAHAGDTSLADCPTCFDTGIEQADPLAGLATEQRDRFMPPGVWVAASE